MEGHLYGWDFKVMLHVNMLNFPIAKEALITLTKYLAPIFQE